MRKLTFYDKILVGIGFSMASLIAVGGIENNINNGRRTKDLIRRSFYRASGEDGILDDKEEVKFMKDLGLEYAVQEGQKLKMRLNFWEYNKVDAYLDSSFLGSIEYNSLKKYLGEEVRKY